MQRRGTFQVQLALKNKLGLQVMQVNRERVMMPYKLNLDNLAFEEYPATPTASNNKNTPNSVQMEPSLLLDNLENSFQGLLVTDVVVDSEAWNQGVRPGDIVMAVSATVGDRIWPKSTLEGLCAAISSRKMVAGTLTLELKRVPALVDNRFQLTLTKPIGLLLKETEDGYVTIAGIKENAPNLVKHALQAGDRVIAVDSSLGDKLWPVSTVEGVISACTSRLPGQSIVMQFERPVANINTRQDALVTMPTAAKTSVETFAAPIDHKKLQSRCRDILKRFANEKTPWNAPPKFLGKYGVPAIVADKVVDALASASAVVDSVTLSMIMSSYMSSNQPDGALKAFEAATGFAADGSTGNACEFQAQNGNSIVPSESTLDLYTATALLQAHALKGDLASVQRVLAALEGRSGMEIDGQESAPWPWTGSFGAIKPDTKCYNIAIAAAEKIGGPVATKMAMDLFDRMDSAGPPKDVVTYNTLISILANSGVYDETFACFDRMKQAGIRPDKYTYTSLMKVCNEDDIEEVVYDMKELGVEADVVTYNTMLKTLCDDRKLGPASKLITEMEASGVAPDSMTYGYLMAAMLRAKKASACLALLESACSNSKTVALTDSVYLYTTAITAASMIGDHGRALELVSRMSANGIKPNLKTLTAVMGACLSSNRADLAAQLFLRIEKPDGYATSQGVKALCESGEAGKAFDVIQSQHPRATCLTGKQVMSGYESVMKAGLCQNNFEVTRKAITDMLTKGYIPNMAILSLIADSINTPSLEFDGDKFSFCLFVLDALSDRNLPVEGRLYSSVLLLGNRLGGLDRHIASLIVSSKIDASRKIEKLFVTEEVTPATAVMAPSWEALRLNYSSVQERLKTLPISFPNVRVRIGKRDILAVLKAEQGLANKSKSRSTRWQAV
jgi:pentatricopeptide repeat protein